MLTFPIPGVPNATATATLDAKFMAERVVVKNGANTYEFTYSDYKDWNNPLNPAEAFYAGQDDGEEERHRRPRHYDDADGNGTDVCRDAGSGQRQGGDQANESASQLDSDSPTHRAATQTAAVVTPRLANGKPDMTGTWGGRRLIQSRVVEPADVVQRR